jgi:hypothetical protein
MCCGYAASVGVMAQACRSKLFQTSNTHSASNVSILMRVVCGASNQVFMLMCPSFRLRRQVRVRECA